VALLAPLKKRKLSLKMAAVTKTTDEGSAPAPAETSKTEEAPPSAGDA
jgi:hypothetical protein